MIDIQQFGQISATEKSNAHVYSKEHVIIIHRQLQYLDPWTFQNDCIKLKLIKEVF